MDNVILVGNPNTGKTTLYNRLTKSDEHIGNWHGVTVDAVSKAFVCNGHEYNIIDLPGVYSLTAFNPEETVTIDYLLGNRHKILNVCDINNLSHNLYLTLQLLEAGFDVRVVVNITDQKDHSREIASLKKAFGAGVAFVNFQRDKNLHTTIDGVLNAKNTIQIDLRYINTFCKSAHLIEQNARKLNISKEFAWLKIIENDVDMIERLALSEAQVRAIEDTQMLSTSSALAKARYDYIAGLSPKAETRRGTLDAVLLNKYLAIPIFLGVMLAIFYVTFGAIGTYLKDGLSYIIQDLIGENIYLFMQAHECNYVLTDFVYKGLICGVGGIVSFLPQIVLLLFFLSILEESGYLSRLAFIFDDLFAKVGLSGKSLFTLIMSFGCSTIAMMTARNIEDENIKKKTIILAPYMCCSAKLPMFVMITSAFFSGNFLIIFALYLMTILISLLVAVIYNKKLPHTKDSFILEFPMYRVPSVSKMLKFIYSNTMVFVSKVGSVLILFSLIFYFLNTYDFNLIHVDLGGISIMQRVCELIAPIFAPLGFGEWGAVSALVSGVVAKEIIVGSIGMINGVDAGGIAESLMDASANISFDAGSALAFIVFALLYAPCLSSISVMVKQLGSAETTRALVLEFVVAYLVALGTFWINKILDINLVVILMLSLVLAVIVLSKGSKCAGCRGRCADCFLK